MKQLPQILFVEDDRGIASALAHALQINYRVDVAFTGQTALYKVDNGHYDIIILDLNLPDISGMIVCRQLRDRGLTAPILILTAETKVLTKISLLDAGANDYLTKPFSLGELKARLRVLTRINYQTTREADKLTINDISLDRKTRQVSCQGAVVKLRRKEFALLECLMEHAGSVVTRRALMRYAWHGAESLWTNTVDVHINHLRAKIDRPFGRSLIRTVHGLGYKLEVMPGIPAAKK